MSPKHPHHRHSHPPARSPHARRGRSRSRSSLKPRSSSAQPHSSVRARSRSHPRAYQRVSPRDIPIYIPSDAPHANAIPKIIADALRQRAQAQNEALAASNLGNRLPTPPPEPDVQGVPRHATPRLKRRPSSSPAAAKARRRRRRRPRPQQQSMTSMQDDPIPPPQPELSAFYPPRPVSPSYSFFSMMRAKGEKERGDRAKGKREREEGRRKRKKDTAYRGRRDDSYGGYRDRHDSGFAEADNATGQVGSMPPLDREQHAQQEGLPYDRLGDEPDAGSRRGSCHRHKHGKQRQKKHHRRSGEQHHRRQKRRSKYRVRDFFASLRRKLGNLLRLTPPAASSSVQSVLAYADAGNWTSVAREPSDNRHRVSQSTGDSEQPQYERWDRRRGGEWRRSKPPPHPPPPPPYPYFTHGVHSPADSWHSRLSRPGGRRRFTTATAESAVGSGATSPRRPAKTKGSSRAARVAGNAGSRRLSHHSSGSTISIIARRFMGPFLSEPSDAAAQDGDGSGSIQRKLSWRSHRLLTAASRPATPPLSRSPSPDHGASVPGVYGSSSMSSSMGLRDLYPSPSSSSGRRNRSVSPYRISTPEYGLADLFAAAPRVSSNPVYYSTPLRFPSSDSGLQRLFASPPASPGSNFGLRRIFGD